MGNTEGVEITLSTEKAEHFFYLALCNTVSTGWMAGYGLFVSWDGDAYKAAKAKLVEAKKETCSEDILMQILRDGGTLSFIDEESGGEYTRTVTLADIHEKAKNTPAEHLLNFINEDDDVVTGDVLLQTILYGEIMFG